VKGPMRYLAVGYWFLMFMIMAYGFVAMGS